MAINKVVYGDQTLVDLTQDSVEASNLLEGETAHDRSGNQVTGTAKQGHIVQNSSGTDMTQRSKLQFVGVYTEDDGTNNRTKVNIVREMTKEQMDALSSDEKKGFIRTTNEPNAPYSAISNAEVNFTEASTRANIASGESISTLFGKIKKFFTDLKAVAFSGSASDVAYDSNTTVKQKIDEIQVISTTLPNVSTQKFVNLPTGYTRSNTFILSVMGDYGAGTYNMLTRNRFACDIQAQGSGAQLVLWQEESIFEGANVRIMVKKQS